ncbi:twin-arginine translocation signal domain-containing protein [Escherichia coli]|nr:twin-arginine translocation signal domain-containing protein [Escherichia coli]
MNNEETFYQAMRRQGVTRRSFLKYCSLAATSLGLGAGMAPKIAWALENKPRIPVVWIHGLECTCCTESFIRSAHPLAKDVILSLISLDYDDTLMAAAGTQAEEVFEDIITQYNGKYILAVEGNPPLGEQGMFCISSGRPFIEKLKRAAAGASAIIAWGTCASWGCVQAARPNPTQATPIDKVITDKPIIKVPGCPPIPDVMSAIITYMVTFDRLPDVDRMGRPLMFYGQRIHDKCYRRAGSFYSRVVDIPQMGTHSTADTVGLTALGVVAAAVGVHAVASAVDQRRRHNQQPTETEHQPGNEDKQA